MNAAFHDNRKWSNVPFEMVDYRYYNPCPRPAMINMKALGATLFELLILAVCLCSSYFSFWWESIAFGEYTCGG